MRNNNSEKQNTFRLAPCAHYDIEGIESWLESMAEEGYFLSKSRFFDVFETGSARCVRYRLQASRSTPDNEAVEICKAFGWEFITNRRGFHIYATNEPKARELNTDPKVQALSIRIPLKKECYSQLAKLFFLLLSYSNLLIIINGTLLAAIEVGSMLLVSIMLLFLGSMLSPILKIVYLQRITKRLSTGEMLEHKKNWKKHSRYYQAKSILSTMLSIMLLGGFFGGLFHIYISDKNELSLLDYNEELPFALIKDINPEGVYCAGNSNFNTITARSDLLSPTIIKVIQDGSLSFEDGSTLDILLFVDYYDTVSPWTARRLAYEQQAIDILQLKRFTKYDTYQLLEAPVLDVDYAAAYEFFFDPALIMVDENKMIRILLHLPHTSDNKGMTSDEYMKIFAEHFKN
jgi:hypothetical protein